MTRLEALRDLLAKVEAGETPEDLTILSAFPDLRRICGWGAVALINWAMNPDDIRAMGAAKALHEAALPEWWLQHLGQVRGGWRVRIETQGKSIPDNLSKIYADTPARAWLIAIFYALVAKETADD